MESFTKNEIVFTITVGDLQNEANEKIGRKLNDDEIAVARKGLEFGLLTDIDSVYNTIFFEMIK
jgi:hypothetical protein